MTSERPITVMSGGSFNPPTIAHIRLLDHAVNFFGTDAKGVFVPSSNDYVGKKIRRHGGANPLISFDDRLAIIYEYLLDADLYNARLEYRIDVSDIERNECMAGNTYRSLCTLQGADPSREVVFLLGDDRLPVLAKWGSIETLLKNFRVAVLTRTGQKDLSKIPLLAKYAHRFIFIDPPEHDYSKISSSGFWKAFSKKSDDVYTHVTPHIADVIAARITPAGENHCASYHEWAKSSLKWTDLLS